MQLINLVKCILINRNVAFCRLIYAFLGLIPKHLDAVIENKMARISHKRCIEFIDACFFTVGLFCHVVKNFPLEYRFCVR